MARAQTPFGADVGAVSTEIAPGNDSRAWVIVMNDSDTVVYVAADRDAVAHAGIRLNPYGGFVIFSKDGDMFTNGPINGIHLGTGTKRMTVQEAV